MTVFSNLTASFASLLCCASVFAGQTTVGATYDIAEPDVLEEIQAKATGVNWQAAMNRNKDSWSGWGSAAGPEAQRDGESRLTPTYTLDFDVPDKTGNVVYPKGYQFNPLEYIQLPGRIIVIGKGEHQARWAKEIRKEGDIILTVGGDPLKLGEQLEQPVYLLDEHGVNRFGITAVPSLIEQNGQEFVIRHFYVKAK